MRPETHSQSLNKQDKPDVWSEFRSKGNKNFLKTRIYVETLPHLHRKMQIMAVLDIDGVPCGRGEHGTAGVRSELPHFDFECYPLDNFVVAVGLRFVVGS